MGLIEIVELGQTPKANHVKRKMEIAAESFNPPYIHQSKWKVAWPPYSFYFIFETLYHDTALATFHGALSRPNKVLPQDPLYPVMGPSKEILFAPLFIIFHRSVTALTITLSKI